MTKFNFSSTEKLFVLGMDRQQVLLNDAGEVEVKVPNPRKQHKKDFDEKVFAGVYF